MAAATLTLEEQLDALSTEEVLTLLRKTLLRRALENADEVTNEEMLKHVETSPTFAFLWEEEDIYTLDRLKEKYEWNTKG
jgi:hypothetical protein